MSIQTRGRPWPEVQREEMIQHPEVFAALEAHFASIRAGNRPILNRPFIVIEMPEDMPSFENEHEEWEFWNVHTMGDAWYENVQSFSDDELPPVRPRGWRRPDLIRES